MTRIGVIGVGTMGSNHVRILSEMEDVEVSVSDLDKEKCFAIADKFKVKSYYFDHKELLKENLDGVVIAVPSKFHKDVFLDCVESGVNVLVEKPISENVEDAELMIEKAKEKGIIFTVGHVERFNPVVTKMKSLMKEIGDVYLVNTIRAGPFPKRFYGSHGGVLLDLAVHDIDVISFLVGKISDLYAHVLKTGNQEIYANVLYGISEKTKGSSEFSWVSPKRVRKIEVFGTNGMLSGDYHNQTLSFWENPESGEVPHSSNLFEEILMKGNISAGKANEHEIEKEEPLKLELQNFLDSINKGTEVLVKPEEALHALKVAVSILKSGKDNNAVKIE